MVCHGMASRLSSTCSWKKNQQVGTSRRIKSLNDVDIDRSYEKTVDLGRILQIIGSPLVPGSFEMLCGSPLQISKLIWNRSAKVICILVVRDASFFTNCGRFGPRFSCFRIKFAAVFIIYLLGVLRDVVKLQFLGKQLLLPGVQQHNTSSSTSICVFIVYNDKGRYLLSLYSSQVPIVIIQ